MNIAAQDFVMVYITVADKPEAIRIAHALVDAKLVACVNILGEITSVYRWDHKIEEATEVALIAKTRLSLFDEVREKVKSIHSYDVPCIVAYPMSEADASYLAWIRSETLVA